METLGKKLKELREQKGMTLKDIAKEIKVRESVILSLENEEWDKLPQRIFVKGFVRAYSKSVDGDESYILDLFESSYPYKNPVISCPSFESSPVGTIGRSRNKQHSWVVGVITLFLLVGGIYMFLGLLHNSKFSRSGKGTKEVETTVVTPPRNTAHHTIPATSPLPTKTPVEKSAQGITSSPVPTNIPSQVSSENSPPVERKIERPRPEQTTPPEKSEKPATPVKGTQVLPPVTVPTSSNNLTINAKEDTWIGLKVGGKLQKQVLLKPGETFSTRIEKPVVLLIGNAGGIEITFNGKQMGSIGKLGEVVRLRLNPNKH